MTEDAEFVAMPEDLLCAILAKLCCRPLAAHHGTAVRNARNRVSKRASISVSNSYLITRMP